MSITSPRNNDDDPQFEERIRPSDLPEFIGQTRIRRQLELVLQSAQKTGVAPDHMLLAGPPGLGKTTLALIVSKHVRGSLRLTSGPAISSAADLASLLSSLNDGDLLFIDEIHRMSRASEELLYLAMEDFRIDVMVGKGPGATSISLDLPRFTLVGATTRSGMLPNPLRDRFGFTAFLEYYSEDELAQVLQRAGRILDLEVSQNALEELARRSRGTPRIANRLLRRAQDLAIIRETTTISADLALEVLDLFEIDELGLDRIDRAILEVLGEKFGGQPVGLKTISIAIGEEPDTIEEVVEPFLVRLGLVARTQRGRQITPAGLRHLSSSRNR